MADTIGGYQILGELGRGAMGIVYHAQDPRIGRAVAIKLIRVDTATTADEGALLRQRLVREATAAGKLSHANIVTIHQLGEEGPDVFFVMEYVPGPSLERVLSAGGAMEPARTIGILRQVADALDYAHRAGVVHRDVKPANILLREDGCVKVADFGIAKVTETAAAQSLTATGSNLGSPAYMSPEQVRAEQVDGRSDQFSLGIIAHRMLTGRLPFTGDSAHSMMFQIVSADPFATQPWTLPPMVVTALRKALAKTPAERFATCGEFVRELSAAVTAPPVAATSQTLPPPSVTAQPRIGLPGKTKLAIALIALLLAIVTGAWWFMRGKDAGGGGSKKVEAPLVKAIAEGKLDEAQRLLDRGVDANQADSNGMTALMQAAEGSAYMPNNVPAVILLLGKGASVDLVDKRGRTALSRAAAEGKVEAMTLLLDKSANPNQKGTDGATPLMTSVTYGKQPAARLLLERGADPDLTDATGTTALMIAAEGTAYMPNNAPFVSVLLAKGAKTNLQDQRGRTALYRAAAEGKTEVLRLLIDELVDPNQKASDGSTPLIEAVTYGRLPAVKLLLERGAQVDLADAGGSTPLMIAAEGTAYMPNNAPLVEALLAAGAKVDAQDDRGRSPLLRAASEGKADAVRLLLDKKANINLKETSGSTPLMRAVEYGRLAAATVLLDRGADANLADSNGTTPLMIASEGSPYIQGPEQFVSLLLAHKAKLDAVDNRGRTALARATEHKNDAVIPLLKPKQ